MSGACEAPVIFLLQKGTKASVNLLLTLYLVFAAKLATIYSVAGIGFPENRNVGLAGRVNALTAGTGTLRPEKAKTG
jgi:hypothetical protein